MGIFLAVCTALVATASAYRLGYRLWAEHPPVRTPRPAGAELTVYEVAALRSWPLHPDLLARTVVTAMVLSGTLRVADGRLRVVAGATTTEPVLGGVLARLRTGVALTPTELAERVEETEEVLALERDLTAAGMLSRGEGESPVNVSLGVMTLTAVLGALMLISNRSLAVPAVFAGLLAVGGLTALATPVRYDRATGRSRRLLARVGTEPGRLPVLPPGLLLDGPAHLQVARVALGLHGPPGFSFETRLRGPAARPGRWGRWGRPGRAASGGQGIGEGPGLGGL